VVIEIFGAMVLEYMVSYCGGASIGIPEAESTA
jgi:hypothetical protein